MLKIIRTASLVLAVCFGTNPACADAAATDCAAHFTSEGSIPVGKKYSTWLEFPAVTKLDAYSRIYAAVAKDGWNIVNADKDAGVLSASQNVPYGNGSQTPMLIVVEVSKNGSKVTATFRTGGGQTAKEETVRTKLCSYLGAVSP